MPNTKDFDSLIIPNRDSRIQLLGSRQLISSIAPQLSFASDNNSSLEIKQTREREIMLTGS